MRLSTILSFSFLVLAGTSAALPVKRENILAARFAASGILADVEPRAYDGEPKSSGEHNQPSSSSSSHEDRQLPSSNLPHQSAQSPSSRSPSPGAGTSGTLSRDSRPSSPDTLIGDSRPSSPGTLFEDSRPPSPDSREGSRFHSSHEQSSRMQTPETPNMHLHPFFQHVPYPSSRGEGTRTQGWDSGAAQIHPSLMQGISNRGSVDSTTSTPPHTPRRPT